ncbi:MAG: helix-hairpin-helix domain-containing protein [Natronomonas sp.]
MGLLQKLKTAFGIGDSGSADATEVTVEHEPDTDTEAAIKGTDEPVATDTDATASTGSMTQTPTDSTEAAEPAEAGAGVTEHSGTETEAAEPAEAAGPVPDSDSDGPDASNDPIENISGIGPAYAARLGDAGVETVAELLAADPEELADATELSSGRIERWQDRARQH